MAKYRKLGRTSNQRKALLRNQVTQLLYHGKIRTTEAKGRKANTKKLDLAQKIFDEYGPKYAGRNGGYTRIVKIGQRKGDAALEVIIELV